MQVYQSNSLCTVHIAYSSQECAPPKDNFSIQQKCFDSFREEFLNIYFFAILFDYFVNLVRSNEKNTF